MALNMSQTHVADSSERLKKLLYERTRMELSARLLGFKSWDSYWHQRDLPLSPPDAITLASSRSSAAASRTCETPNPNDNS